MFWLDDDRRSHPTSGPREDVDELLQRYGSTFEQPFKNRRKAEETRRIWNVARGMLRENFTRDGWLEGFTNEEVDFYYAPDDNLVEVAIGVNPDDWRVKKFGLGLNVWARLLPQGEAFDDHGTNVMNIALMRNFAVSVLGHITGGPREEQ